MFNILSRHFQKKHTIKELQIISLIKARDQKGLTLLYEQYSDTIYGVITRIVVKPTIAEEVLQESFLKAWNKIEKYNETKSSLYTWLSAIARNAAKDRVRLKSYQNNKKTETLKPSVHIGNTTETDQSKIDTTKLLKNLDDKYRIVLDLMYLQGFTQAEIAEKLEIPIGTVKTRIRTAIQILRIELKDEKTLFFGSIIIILILLFL